MIINKVTLYSHVWDEMRSFYVDVLGFELFLQTDDGFEIKAGESMLQRDFKRTCIKCFPTFSLRNMI